MCSESSVATAFDGKLKSFFKTLKSGCRIEHRRFEDIDRMLNCLAFYSMVAWWHGG